MPTIPTANAVYGLSGKYRDMNNAFQTLNVSTVESGADRYSHDLYAGMDVIGNFDHIIDMNGIEVHNRDSLAMVAYDYLTNSIVIRTGSLSWYGWIDSFGLHLGRLGRNYLAISPQFGIPFVYRRMP
jgi:hypothetical protein